MTGVAKPSHEPGNARLLLDVAGLRVDFRVPAGRVRAVDGISFRLQAGQCLALVGESGSGKSATARALLGLAGDNATVTADRLHLLDRDLTTLPPDGWQDIRGREAGLVLQDALSALDPLRRIGPQVAGPLHAHRIASRREARSRAVGLLSAVGLPDPETRARQYPHQLSGGQRQRALIASALACHPPLLIADEPTTALDVTVQAQILGLLAERKRLGTALLLISHDLSVVARLADIVAVMRAGRILETGPTGQVLTHPQHSYTRQLIASVPGTRPKRTTVRANPRPRLAQDPPTAAQDANVLLDARDLVKHYAVGRGRYTAVDHVSFQLRSGQTLGLVGESGSGKTTTARLVMADLVPDAGLITLSGKPWSTVSERERRPRRRDIQAIHQDPLAAFDPRFTVGQIVAEAVDRASLRTSRQRRERVVELLGQVGLDGGLLGRHPSQLSGGQRQRVAIARALAPEPRILVCDEPVSALDVTVQAQILELLASLQRERDLAMLFISHDLGVIRQVSNQIAVMRAGHIVEAGETEALYARPAHPYTLGLLEAVPRIGAAPETEGVHLAGTRTETVTEP